MKVMSLSTAGVRCPGSAAQRRLQRTAAHVAPAPRAAVALPPLLRRAPAHARAVAARAVSVRAAAADGAASPAVNVPKVKEFLEAMKALGSIRIILNNGVAVLESVTTFEGLFYSPVPNKGEYANLIKSAENVDMHLLVDKVASAVLESAPGRGPYTSHLVRVRDAAGVVAATFYLMWPEGAARGAYAPGQVEAFQALVAKYGSEVSFLL